MKIKNLFGYQINLFCQHKIYVVKRARRYFSFSDSIAFLLSLTLARKAGPSTAMTTLAHKVNFELRQENERVRYKLGNNC